MRILLFNIVVAAVGFTTTSGCSRTSEPTVAFKTGDIFLMVNVDLGPVIQQELSDTLIWIWFGIISCLKSGFRST